MQTSRQTNHSSVQYCWHQLISTSETFSAAHVGFLKNTFNVPTGVAQRIEYDAHNSPPPHCTPERDCLLCFNRVQYTITAHAPRDPVHRVVPRCFRYCLFLSWLLSTTSSCGPKDVTRALTAVVVAFRAGSL